MNELPLALLGAIVYSADLVGIYAMRWIAVLFMCALGTSSPATADQSLLEALTRLRDAHRARDDVEIFRWTFKVSLQSKDPYYRARVGDYFWEGRGVVADPGLAVDWYTSAAARGSAHGMMGLARAYYLGRGVARDVDVAAHWLERAAGRGSWRAYWEFASHQLSRPQTPDSAARAQDYIARGLEARAAAARQANWDSRAKGNPIGAAYLAAGDSFGCPIAAPSNLRLALGFWLRAGLEGYAAGWRRLRRFARYTLVSGELCDAAR